MCSNGFGVVVTEPIQPRALDPGLLSTLEDLRRQAQTPMVDLGPVDASDSVPAEPTSSLGSKSKLQPKSKSRPKPKSGSKSESGPHAEEVAAPEAPTPPTPKKKAKKTRKTPARRPASTNEAPIKG